MPPLLGSEFAVFGLPILPLPHTIGSGSGILDEILTSVGLVLIPVLAYGLFRLGRWARKAGRDEEDTPGHDGQ
ncbi:MAG: hypothetical protein EXR47_00240 [Dehalococcoidia bacterium]|nr:hypothetical protein [Dehalococcoidia bacterium]